MTSSSAQILEHGFRIIAMLGTAVVADSYGRRPLLIYGTVCVILGMLCFILASLFTPVARPLFIVAQGLQGALTFDLLGPIIAADLANKEGADSQAMFTVMGIASQAASLGGTAIGIGIGYLEMTNFTLLWTTLLAVIVLGFGTSLVSIRETLPKKSDRPEGIVATVRQQLSEYFDLFTTNPLVRNTAIRDALSKLSYTDSINMSSAMANYGFSQSQAITLVVPVFPWIFLCIIFTQPLIPLLGERRLMKFTRMWFQFFQIAFAFAVPLGAWGYIVREYVGRMGLGTFPLEMALMTRSIGESSRTKALVIMSLQKELVTALGGVIYAYLFDAKATSYLGKAAPFIVSDILLASAFGMFWKLIWPIYGPIADTLTAERKAQDKQAASGSAANEKPHEEKKAD